MLATCRLTQVTDIEQMEQSRWNGPDEMRGKERMPHNKKKPRHPSPVSRQMSRMLTQARESLRLLETLEKETLAKARTFVRNPLRVSRPSLSASLRNDKIAASLRSLGVASRAEVEKLERRIAQLESVLRELRPIAASQKVPPPENAPDAFPNA
jgi:hypothetical protein